MKKWTTPEFITLDINETENGGRRDRFEVKNGIGHHSADTNCHPRNQGIPWPWPCPHTDDPS